MISILVIDDDPHIVDVLKAKLNSASHAIFSAKDWMEGLKYINIFTFDLVIIEIFMPETDGLEVMANLKMKTSCPKIIAMFKGTPWINRGPWLLAVRLLGADKVLFKPFGVDELLACLQELLVEPGVTSD